MDAEKLHIRKAIRADAEALHNLHTVSVTALCKAHYSDCVVAKWLKRRSPEGYFEGLDQGAMFVGEYGGKIVGFVHAVPGEVIGLFVHPDQAARGVGATLLSQGMRMARPRHDGPIKVVATLNARSFYEKHGFVEVKRYSIQKNNTDIPVVEMKKEI